MLSSSAMTVKIRAGYRIHLGFYRFNDPPFIYGSLGASVINPYLELIMHTIPSNKLIIESSTEESMNLIRSTISSVSPSFKGYVKVKGFIKHHVGLGTRTRLILTTLAAMKELGLIRGYNELIDKAHELGIGKYSAVGLYTFLKGGLVIDTGRDQSSQELPNLLIRLPFPRDWSVILALPSGIQGLPEHAEEPVMNTPRNFKHQKELYSSILALIHSLRVRDFELFTKSINRIQEFTGEYFSKYQGGIFCCNESRTIAEELRKKGFNGIGQSSWGPLIYGFINSSIKAKEAAELLRAAIAEVGIEPEILLTNISGIGYSVHTT